MYVCVASCMTSAAVAGSLKRIFLNNRWSLLNFLHGGMPFLPFNELYVMGKGILGVKGKTR